MDPQCWLLPLSQQLVATLDLVPPGTYCLFGAYVISKFEEFGRLCCRAAVPVTFDFRLCSGFLRRFSSHFLGLPDGIKQHYTHLVIVDDLYTRTFLRPKILFLFCTEKLFLYCVFEWKSQTLPSIWWELREFLPL